MTELLPILDDFDRAHKVAVDAKTVESVSEGMRLVHQKFINTLTLQGLQAIDSNEAVFDPEIHEAIAEIPAPSEQLKGKVVDTVEKGYTLNGIIIRHPKVVVGK
jgi:molecular chaperone GrpE